MAVTPDQASRNMAAFLGHPVPRPPYQGLTDQGVISALIRQLDPRSDRQIIQEDLVRPMGVQGEYDRARAAARSGRKPGQQGTKSLFDLGDVTPEDARMLKGYGPERKRMLDQLVNIRDADPGTIWADPNATTAAEAIPGAKARVVDTIGRTNMTDAELGNLLGQRANTAEGQVFAPPRIEILGGYAGRHSRGVPYEYRIDPYAGAEARGQPPEAFQSNIEVGASPGRLDPRTGETSAAFDSKDTERTLLHELGHAASLREGPESTAQQLKSAWDRSGKGEVAPYASVIGPEEAKADWFSRRVYGTERAPGHATATPGEMTLNYYDPSNYYDFGSPAAQHGNLTTEELAKGRQIFNRGYTEKLATIGDPNALTNETLLNAFPGEDLPGPKARSILEQRANEMFTQPPREVLLAREHDDPPRAEIHGTRGSEHRERRNRGPLVDDEKSTRGAAAGVSRELENPLTGEGGFVRPKMAGEGAAALLVPIAANYFGGRIGGDTGEEVRNAGLGFGLGMAGGAKTALIGAGLAGLGTYLKNQFFK